MLLQYYVNTLQIKYVKHNSAFSHDHRLFYFSSHSALRLRHSWCSKENWTISPLRSKTFHNDQILNNAQGASDTNHGLKTSYLQLNREIVHALTINMVYKNIVKPTNGDDFVLTSLNVTHVITAFVNKTKQHFYKL